MRGSELGVESENRVLCFGLQPSFMIRFMESLLFERFSMENANA